MITAAQIKNNASVVCSQNVELGVVDHMEGASSVKLKKDKTGVHHYIPLSWVTKVDDKVHLDRAGSKAMQEWSLTPPTKNSLQS